MKNKIMFIFISIFTLLFLLSGFKTTKAQEVNACASHPNRMWAWSLDGAWMSTNKTGNWETDDWFYMLKSGESVVVTQIDGKLGYYLVCYDFDSENGWQPIYGWVQKNKILLQSQITPESQ